VTVVRCTVRLLKLVAGSPSTRSMEPAADDWYANLLWLDGRKCLLITHAASLFSIFEPDVVKASLTPLGPFAVRLIERELAAESLPPTTFGALEASIIVVGRTCSRSVLGTMTDMRYQIEAVVHESRGLRQLDLPGLNRSLRRIPFSAIRPDRPIDRARALRAEQRARRRRSPHRRSRGQAIGSTICSVAFSRSAAKGCPPRS